MDSGLHSLLLMASLHGIAADEARLRHAFGAEPFSAQTLLLAAKSLAMKARLVSQPVERLDRAPLPAIGLIVATAFSSPGLPAILSFPETQLSRSCILVSA